ncbi:MAG: Rieske (2Fe-2S) domain protein [Caulobacteraceae bacterium]|nr:Rieske (2Fe-2S) domain protein [Caulobacteraceae bacterium]
MSHYPFAGPHRFARNQWYIGAWSAEVGPEPLGRTILGEDVVFYRTSSGDVAALSGICPHRWAPLAKGRVVEDAIQCPYHGAAFDRSGRCTLVPSQPRTPPTLRLRAYPVIERGPCIWIWPGDADLADALLLPDQDSLGLGAAGWRADYGGPVLVNARAQIILENLFDQSHINFVHPQTLGGPESRSDPHQDEVFDTRDRFCVVHRMAARATDDSVRALFPDAGDYVAAHLHVELLGVSLIDAVGSRTFSTDAAGGAPRALGCMNFVHGLTPQTPTTTHYFNAVTRNFALDIAELSTFLVEHNAKVMREDIALLEAIELSLDRVADARKEVTFAADAVAMQVRRRIERIAAADSRVVLI